MAFTPNVSSILSSVNTPVTVYNYLRPNAFKFTISDLPNVAYTCQSANIPAVQLGFATQPTPFIDIPTIGDKLTYSEFSIRFLIAEDMVNYRELLEWIVALGFPENYEEYPAFVGDRLGRFPFYKNSQGNTDALAYSDGTLTILDSVNNPKINIFFKGLFPTSVEALDYDITSSSVDYLVGVASFKYKMFEIEAL